MHILDRVFNGEIYGPVLNERFVFSALDLSEATILIISCTDPHDWSDRYAECQWAGVWLNNFRAASHL